MAAGNASGLSIKRIRDARLLSELRNAAHVRERPSSERDRHHNVQPGRSRAVAAGRSHAREQPALLDQARRWVAAASGSSAGELVGYDHGLTEPQREVQRVQKNSLFRREGEVREGEDQSMDFYQPTLLSPARAKGQRIADDRTVYRCTASVPRRALQALIDGTHDQ